MSEISQGIACLICVFGRFTQGFGLMPYTYLKIVDKMHKKSLISVLLGVREFSGKLIG